MAPNPAAMRRRARIMRAVNVPMRAVLSLPVATPLSANLMLISYTGRKTGKAYRQPVSYVRDGDVLLTPGGGRWTLNLTDGRPVRIRLRGREVVVWPELVSDAAEVERLLGVIATKNPRAGRFIPIPRRPDGRLDPGVLDTALRRGFRIVRWHLRPGGAGEFANITAGSVASMSDPQFHRERREHGGAAQHLDDDKLAEMAEDERVDAGLDDYNPDEVPPATDPLPPGVPEQRPDVRQGTGYREEQAEIRREEEAGELREPTEDDPFPPTRYDEQ